MPQTVEFSLPNQDGETISSADLTGQGNHLGAAYSRQLRLAMGSPWRTASSR